MAYDLQEQEQIDAIKAWWKEHGALVIVAITVGALTIAAFQGWRYYRHNQALAAVTLYEQLERAERADDAKKMRDIAARLVAQYGSTPYATFAALTAARVHFESGDFAGAKAQLQWVVQNAREDEIRDVARLRLAGVLLDEKNHAEALKMLEEKPVDSLTGLFADLKGDVLSAQGKRDEARGAYQLALDRSQANSPYRETIRLKLDALGEAKRRGNGER